MRHALSISIIATILSATSAHAAEKAAVFDFQLANLAQLPPTAADKARLPKISDLLRQELQKGGKFSIVPITPKVKEEVAKSAELRSCGGCAVDFAKQLDAQVAITGQIQKVSDLILDITVYVRPVDNKTAEKAYSVSIRGDTDASFEHGIKFLVSDNMAKT